MAYDGQYLLKITTLLRIMDLIQRFKIYWKVSVFFTVIFILLVIGVGFQSHQEHQNQLESKRLEKVLDQVLASAYLDPLQLDQILQATNVKAAVIRDSKGESYTYRYPTNNQRYSFSVRGYFVSIWFASVWLVVDPGLVLVLAIGVLLSALVVYFLTVSRWQHRFQRVSSLLNEFSDSDFSNLQSVKAFDPRLRVGRTLNRLVSVLRSASKEGARVDKHIRATTFLDEETGVGNRIFFDNRLDALLSDQDRPYGVVMLIQLQDLEILEVNHGKEDALDVLKTYCHTINNYIRRFPEAILARRNHLDLAILIPLMHKNEAEQAASHLLKSLKKVPVPKTTGMDLEQFFHIGVVECAFGDSSYQVMSEADMALRAAQLQGPCSWYMYDRKIMSPAMAKGSVQWRTLLEKAIAKNSFYLFFQPVVEAQSEEIHHHEALARLRGDDGGYIRATIFLPMAIKCGLIVDIDKLIITKVLRTLEQEKRQAYFCSVNINVQSLLSKEFSDWLITTLLKHATIAPRLIIEIPEYPLTTNSKRIKQVLANIKKTGVRLAVDHVGQYVVSSFYIEQHHIDILKLHGSIVRNIHESTENQLFIRSLQAVNRQQKDITLFAQGVEKIEEWSMLKSLKVNGGQGTYFNEPLEGDEVVFVPKENH